MPELTSSVRPLRFSKPDRSYYWRVHLLVFYGSDWIGQGGSDRLSSHRHCGHQPCSQSGKQEDMPGYPDVKSKILQPLGHAIPGDRYCDKKPKQDQFHKVLTEQSHDIEGHCSHDFSDTDFLGSLL